MLHPTGNDLFTLEALRFQITLLPENLPTRVLFPEHPNLHLLRISNILRTKKYLRGYFYYRTQIHTFCESIDLNLKVPTWGL